MIGHAGVGFDERGSLVPTHEEDFATALDGAEPDEPGLLFTVLGEMLREIKRYELYGQAGSGPLRMEQIARRSVATAYLSSPVLLEGKSLDALGEELQCTRANLSKLQLHLADSLNVRSVLGKTQTAREHYSLDKKVRGKIIRAFRRIKFLSVGRMIRSRYFKTSKSCIEWCDHQCATGLLQRSIIKPSTGRTKILYSLR